MSLDTVKEWLYGCTRCGTCKSVQDVFMPSCPAGEKYRLESYFASGKQFIARGVSEGKISLSDDDIRERIYACTGCLSCQQICGVYHHDHIFEIVQALRTEALNQGFFNPGYMMMYYGLRGEDNVFGKPKTERGDWAKGLDIKYAAREKVEVLYHAGCMLSFEPELWNVPRSVIEIMKAAGVDAGIMGKEETCCGGRSYEIGYLGEFTKYAQHNIENDNALGVNKVVISCSDGYSTFKTLYPKVNIGMKFEVLHTTEFINRLIKENKLKFTNKIPLKVTYHDPCHLGRHLPVGLYDPPREILKSIPGIELVEMERIRENAWCCGAGGGVKQANPDLAVWSANERIKEAKATGATALVTSCAWCERNFKDAVKESGENIEIYDVAEIVHKAL
jgi:Fe-S oxidoreductase